MREPSGGLPATSPREVATRPTSVAAVAVGLFVVGALSALGGFAASAVSSCCGSPDPADPTPALLGVGVAVVLTIGAVGLWSGGLPRAAVLLCAAALPVATVAASPSSADLAGLAAPAVLAWLWLWWYLRRPAAETWLGRRAPR